MLHYSHWFRLRKAVTWLSRCKNVLLKRPVTASASLSMREVRDSETLIVKHVQHSYFSSELKSVTDDRPLSRGRRSIPSLFLSMLVRRSSLRGREASPAAVNANPIIIPHQHP